MTLSRPLLERFQQGDASAFAEVVRCHTGLVRSIAAKYWASPFEQEEAMQEAWAHVFKQRATLDPGRAEELAGWVATLARRRMLDLRRRPADPGAAGTEEEPLEELDAAAPSGPDPAEVAELGEAVREFQARLGPAWQRFFALYFVQGLDYPEVADALGISRLRCKYMKKVLLAKAQRSAPLLAALGRAKRAGGEDGAP